jgi:peptidoglycan/LPS O-acetylase OafA/YrhL
MSDIKEIRSLTGLRGFAALYVVFHHFFPNLPMKGIGTILIAHGYLAVDLFFILSGFVMTLNYTELFSSGFSTTSFWRFLGRRIARIYPLYLVATLCAMLWLAFGMTVSSDPVQHHLDSSVFSNFLLNLAMIQSWGLGYSLDGPTWSISAEWAAYLVFPLFLWIGFNASAWKARIGVSVSCLVLVVLTYVSFLRLGRPETPLGIYAPYHAGPLFRCMPEFFIGVFIARLMVQGGAQWLRTRPYLAAGIAASLVLLLCVPKSDLFVVLLVPFFILSLISESSLPSRFFASTPLHHLGVLSYSIYLMHFLLCPILKATRHLLDTHHVAHGQTLASIPALIATYLISLAAFHYVEMPGRRFLRNYFEGRPASTVAAVRTRIVLDEGGRQEGVVLVSPELGWIGQPSMSSEQSDG